MYELYFSYLSFGCLKLLRFSYKFKAFVLFLYIKGIPLRCIQLQIRINKLV